METNQDISTLPPPPPPPTRPALAPSAASPSQSGALSSNPAASEPPKPPSSGSSFDTGIRPGTDNPEPAANPTTDRAPVEHQITATLGVDLVADAHRYAAKLADAGANTHGRSVAHLVADPANALIAVSANPDAPYTSVYDLSRAVEEVETTAGRLLRVAVGGLTRVELADIVESVSGVVEQVFISGPTPALSQQTLEFATLADYAVIVGGSPADAGHVAHILGELAVPNHHVVAEQPVRKIVPPGAL